MKNAIKSALLLLCVGECATKPIHDKGRYYEYLSPAEVFFCSDSSDSAELEPSPVGSKGFKVAVEVNFECSLCIIQLRNAYNAYLELLQIYELEFWVVTSHPHLAYVKLQTKRALMKENPKQPIWVCHQKSLLYQDHTCFISPDNLLLASQRSDSQHLAGSLTETYVGFLAHYEP